jgi:hypothetical protein
MKAKALLWIGIIVLVMGLAVSGCGTSQSNQDAEASKEETNQKIEISMMYPLELTNFEELVENTYDDIDLQVEMTTLATMNGDSERRLRNGHGKDLIITTLPTGDVEEYTSDLSAEDFANDYQATIGKAVLLDGETHYLPLPGQYSGYILNQTLAEEFMETLPQSNEDLLTLLEKAEKKQVGVGEDGTMFGMVSADAGATGTFFIGFQVPDFLGLMDGIQWSADFQEGTAGFSDKWEDSLDWISELAEKGYFNPQAYNGGNTNALPIKERMTSGAMLLCYGNMNLLKQLNAADNGYEYTMLPFLSDKGNPSWVISSPDAYIAINNSLDSEENAEKKDACLRILKLLSSNEGQSAWLADTVANTSYLLDYENTETELPDQIQACVDGGYVYNQQISSDVVAYFGTEMLAVLDGKCSMAEALEAVDDYYKNGSSSVDYDQSVVGTVTEDLLFENNNTRLQETAIGNLVADATAELAGTELAVVNGGGIRASLYAGDVYGADLSAVCPYDNKIIVVETTGAVIRQMLENGISQTYREDQIPSGRFLQVSGLKYSYRPMTKDTEAELLDVTLADGTALEDEKTYQIAINDYMAGASGYIENNGDGFTMLNLYSDDVKKAKNVKLIKETGSNYADAMRAYFKNHANTEITEKCEGRISVISGE